MPPSSDIAVSMNTQLMLEAANKGDVEAAEKFGLRIPQVTCEVFHHFGPGFAIREMHIPAGTFVIGHSHKEPLANMLVKGEMLLFINGRKSLLQAPFFFVGTPGRKSAIALTDSIWQNILVTDSTDPAEIESLFVEHSEAWEKHHQESEK